MDSATFLADPTSAPGPRTKVLKDSLGRGFQVRADALAAEEDLLLITAWFGGDVKYFGLVIDSRWMLPASARNQVYDDLVSDLRGQVGAMGYPLLAAKDRPLFADHVTDRRTSVIKDNDEVWEVRARLLYDDDEGEDLIQLRAWYTERGYLHIVYRTDGTFVAAVSGGNDKDAFERLRGELGRHDIAV